MRVIIFNHDKKQFFFAVRHKLSLLTALRVLEDEHVSTLTAVPRYVARSVNIISQ
jgi:hypothetical protein